MIANHGYQVILDSYVKGVRNFNVTVAYQAMVDEVATHYIVVHCYRLLIEYLVAMCRPQTRIFLTLQDPV